MKIIYQSNVQISISISYHCFNFRSPFDCDYVSFIKVLQNYLLFLRNFKLLFYRINQLSIRNISINFQFSVIIIFILQIEI